MRNIFNSIQLSTPKRNVFDLTHDVKLSMDMGKLVPICLLETVPGDKFKIGAESLIRFAPLVSPVMHRMDAHIHYFFVPNRILWKGWEDWIINPNIGANTHPTINFNTADLDPGVTPLADYMGLPPITGRANIQVSALPFAAYQKIYNDYYRDQNLVPELVTDLTDGDNSTNGALTVLRTRAWEHDYFTASLPFAQKGDQVILPLGTLADTPVKIARNGADSNAFVNYNDGINDLTTTNVGEVDNDHATGDMYAKTSELEIGSTTINDLRRAFRLQEWLERNARAGTRYVESILAHFGVKSSDSRLQRPEYITGVKSPVVISEVLNTTGEQVAGAAPQGAMAGHGISVVESRNGSYFCEEHGWIIGIMSVMPKTAYGQGIAKHWLKYQDNFSYFWPSFANLGEQEVKNVEIYAAQSAANGDLTFGYVPRYAEYKYEQNRIAGDFRTTLDFWHFGRQFANPPALNKTFIECDPGKRIFAVDSAEHSLYVHVLNRIKAVRPMPIFGTPTI